MNSSTAKSITVKLKQKIKAFTETLVKYINTKPLNFLMSYRQKVMHKTGFINFTTTLPNTSNFF